MSITDTLSAFPALAPYTIYIMAFCGFMGFIAQFLPAPTASSSATYDLIYNLVNWTGWNNGHAKNASSMTVKVPTALIALLALGFTLSACGVQTAATTADAEVCGLTVIPQAVPQVQGVASGTTQTNGQKALTSAKVVVADAMASPACIRLAQDIQASLAKPVQ